MTERDLGQVIAYKKKHVVNKSTSVPTREIVTVLFEFLRLQFFSNKI